MPIYFFVASILFVWVVAQKKKIKAISPYWIFFLFQILYNVIPWILNEVDMSPQLFTLLADKRLIDIQLVCSSLANICFASVYLLFWKEVPHRDPDQKYANIDKRNYVLAAVPLFLIVCVLAHFYGWHKYTNAILELGGGNAPGGMYTVTAYAKFLFVAVYLYYLYRFGIDKWVVILMIEHVIVLFVDGARTTFLPIVLITVFMMLDKVKNKQSLRRIYVLAVAGVGASVAARSLVISSTGFIDSLTVTVAVEGAMGDYPSLQSISGIEITAHPSYTMGASYFIDPIIWLIPKSVGRSKLTFFEAWVVSIDPALKESFAPMGGFYYLAEALAAFSYSGALIITTAFASMMVWMERSKNKHRLLYLIWMPTIGLMFIKTQFGNIFKNFLIQVFFMLLLFFLRWLKNGLAWSIKINRHDSYSRIG